MTFKKLKICHVITRMIIGGAQENTLLSVIGLAQKGHEVTLVTGPTTGPEGRLLDNFDASLHPNVRIIETPSLVREICPVTDISAYFKLKKHFREEKYDVVHTHSSKAGIIARLAAWNAGIPIVVHTIHGQAFHRYEKKWKNALYIFLEKISARKSHRIFSVARAMINQCLEVRIAPPEKYKVVYSGMEIEPFLNSLPDKALAERLGIGESDKVIGTVARLFELKGYDYLIPAARKIVDEVPEARFLIVGDGILRESLEKQIAQLGMTGNFVFAGLVKPGEIYRYISLMNVLVHLSLREGLPRAVVQALASGKPAIGFNLDGTPEVILNGTTGFTTEPGNIEEIVRHSILLLKDNGLAEKMGRAGREHVRLNFDWKFMVDSLEKEYFSLLSL